MKLQSHLENGGKGLFYKVSGIFSGAEMIDRTENFFTPDIMQKLCYQIGDLREVERVDMSGEEMQHLAALDQKICSQVPHFKMALVANHDLMFGLSQLYGAYINCPQVEARIFRNLDDAREWIDEHLAHGDLAADLTESVS